MDLTTQLSFFWFLVSSHGYLLPNDGPREHVNADPGSLDIFDPLHLGLFGPDRTRPGLFGHHDRNHDHPGRPDIVGPPNGLSLGYPNQNSEGNSDIKVTTDSSPLKVNLLPKANSTNDTLHKNDTAEQLEKKESEIPIVNNSSKPIKNIKQPTILGKNEPILRTNENITIGTTREIKDICKSEDFASISDKVNITEENTNSEDSIVFPDCVKEMKSKLSNNFNKTSNQSDANKVNYTKNMDAIVFPVQALPMQDMNGKVLLITANGNPQNQALPISNSVFPNRPAVYTIVNTGQRPLYTNIINTVPQNGGQPLNPTWNNGNNNNYQNPTLISSQSPSYNSAVNYPTGDNFNPNVVTSNPSSNIVTNPPVNPGNTPVSSNLVGIPATTSQQQPTVNGYIQPNYYGEQQSLQPVNGFIQQSVSPGAVPSSYNNVPQNGVQNTPNYNGNIAQTLLPVNVLPENNIQPNSNAQQFYVLANSNQPNNNYNSVTQPAIFNSQGTTNVMPDNNQKYILVNVNQQNIPQNGLGNNLYTVQNGQLVPLVPVQVFNGAVGNNAVNHVTPVNGNVAQPNTYLQNGVNPQSNLIAINSNTNQPNLLLVNGATNGPMLLNSQTSNFNGQNPVLINGQANLNGQNILVNPTPNGQSVNLANNGQNLYTLVTVPNNYVGAGGGYSQLSPANLVSLKDKTDKEGHFAAGNSTT